MCGPGSSVGIATELRAGRSGIESRWGRDFPPVQIGPGAHPASCKMGTGSFPGVKCGRGVLLTTHPLLVPRSWKLYLYSPSGPHRACNGITLPLPWPLLIIMWITERDIIINVYWFWGKVPVARETTNKREFSTQFQKHENSLVEAEMFHADRRTDGRTRRS